MASIPSLNTDLWRLICVLANSEDLDGRHVKKINPAFCNDDNDPYWDMMLQCARDLQRANLGERPKDMSRRAFYEFSIYEDYMKDKNWTSSLVGKMIFDQVFLQRHIDTRDQRGLTVLMYQIRRGNYVFVRNLVSLGADLNIKDNGGYTALLRMMTNKRLFDVNAGAISLLVSLGADINTCDDRGFTALISLASHGTPEDIRFLVSLGADVNIKANNGFTALMFASRGKYENAKTFLELGAEVNIQSNIGVTALLYAVGDSAKMTQLLLDHGADKNLCLTNGRTILDHAQNRNVPGVVELLMKA